MQVQKEKNNNNLKPSHKENNFIPNKRIHYSVSNNKEYSAFYGTFLKYMLEYTYTYLVESYGYLSWPNNFLIH